MADYLNEDDLFEGDVSKVNQKIDEIVNQKVAEAVEAAKKDFVKASEDGKVKGEETSTYTREQLDTFNPEELDLAIFKDDDEDVKDTALILFEKGVKALPEGASRSDVMEVGNKVSQRMAKMIASREGGQSGSGAGDGGSAYSGGPLPMNTAGAAAAHITEKVPTTIDEAEELSMKIAASHK